jgi:putative drug exporter of the RND superfamily
VAPGLVPGVRKDPGGEAPGARGLAPPAGGDPAAERAVLRHQMPMFVSERGRGDTARIFIVPRELAASAGNRRLHERLSQRAAAFQDRTGMQAAVGGLGGEYVDYNREVSAFIPLLVICLSVLTFLLLVVILRAIILPAVAILLNLAIVAASFGALKLLFQGADPLLGGPGFVDVVSIAVIFVILFSLSVDYEVFLLTRMHEAYAAGAEPETAIVHGIGKTAAVVTGAALIMLAVFISFGVSGYSTARQFGVGIAFAVALDALVLRLLLLPASMRLLGRWSWWLPRWLDRRLPRLDVEGTALRTEAPAA